MGCPAPITCKLLIELELCGFRDRLYFTEPSPQVSVTAGPHTDVSDFMYSVELTQMTRFTEVQ